MNENLLVVLLGVIIFVLIVIALTAIDIAFNMKYLEKIALRINIIINDLDLLIARADTVIAHFDDEDEHSKSISNKLDAVIANQDEIENEIHEDGGLISRWYAKAYEGIIDIKANNTANSVKTRDILNKIVESTQYIHSVEAEKNRKKKLKKKKWNDESEIIDGECEDCMFLFKSEREEPCVNCSHAYTTKFVSRREVRDEQKS